MPPTLIAGPANPALARSVAALLGVPLGPCAVSRFPDSEFHVELETSVRGADVYLLQPTAPVVEAHLMQLLLLADAARRAGAARLTAVLPYCGYARQDRRATGREPVGIRLVAEMLAAAGIQRLVGVDLHSTALEGVFPMPLEHLSAVPLLARALAPLLPGDAVVVSPDLGASKLAERYARLLDRPAAFVHKRREAGQVSARAVTGDVRGRSVVVVDDMISTGGTIAVAVRALEDAGARPGPVLAATHGLFVGDAGTALAALAPRAVVVTDSVARPEPSALPVRVETLAELLAEAVRRLHEDRSLHDLLAHA